MNARSILSNYSAISSTFIFAAATETITKLKQGLANNVPLKMFMQKYEETERCLSVILSDCRRYENDMEFASLLLQSCRDLKILERENFSSTDPIWEHLIDITPLIAELLEEMPIKIKPGNIARILPHILALC
jgi:hypothetical protein